MTHLTLRNGTYYIRIRIPSLLVPVIGQNEVYRSLKTSKVRLASKRCHLLRIALTDFFAEAQEGTMQRKEIKAKLDQLFNDILVNQAHYIDRFGPKSENRIFFLEQLSRDVRQAAELQRQGDTEGCIQSITNSRDKHLVQKRMMEAIKHLGGFAKAEADEQRMARAEVLTMLSYYFETAAHMHEDSKRYLYSPEKLPSIPQKRSEILISKAIEKYATEKKRARKWTEKTAGETEAPVLDLIEICGDVPVKSITKEDAVSYKDTLASLPPNVSKMRDKYFPTLSLREIADQDHERLVAPQTVNKRLTRVSSFFEWCVRNHHREDNPFRELRVEEARRKASDERQAFEMPEVEQILALAKVQKQTWKQWLPVIGLYSGMRLNEICQLYKGDIVEKDGIWCFSITDLRDDQRLKSANAARFVPIHSRLIDLGILDLAEGDPAERLFPQLRNSKNGYGDAATKWFSRTFRRKLDLGMGSKSFHSLRHTFSTALKNADISVPVSAALVGHAEKSLVYNRYGKEHDTKLLKEAIEAVSYDGKVA